MSASVAKFKTVFLGKDVPINPKNKELLKWCGVFAGEGLAPKFGKKSSHGNLSFRTKSGMIITRSGSDLSILKENELVEVTDCDEKNFSVKANGLFEPSSESFEHLEIYRARKEINVVFHGHSSQILRQAKKLGLVETETEAEFGTVDNLRAVMGILGKSDFIIMKNHGFFCLGRSLAECGIKALEMQKKAVLLEVKK